MEFSYGTLIFAVWSPVVLEDSIWKMLVFFVCVCAKSRNRVMVCNIPPSELH